MHLFVLYSLEKVCLQDNNGRASDSPALAMCFVILLCVRNESECVSVAGQACGDSPDD